MRRAANRSRKRSIWIDTISAEVVLRERAEPHDVVDAVHELRAEHRERIALQVRRHDQHDVREVDRAPLAVGEPAVVHHLEQHVEHVGVRLLDLVEEHDRVGTAPHCLGELTTLVVADVAGRRADEPRHGVLLHVLAHVDADHRPLVVEQELGERASELGLADPGRPEEQERTDRPVRVGQARARLRRIAFATAVTASSWPITRSCSSSSSCTSLRISPSMRRDTGTPVHLLTTSAMSSESTSSFSMRCVDCSSREVLGRLGDPALELGDLAVADLGGPLEV